MAELATDHGADLRHLLGGRQPIQPSHQRSLQGARDRKCRGSNIGLAGTLQHGLG
jgi:hypothetical protein